MIKSRKNICMDVAPGPAEKMVSALPEDIVALMKRVGVLSDSLGFSAFAVGGLVRDIMLGVKNLDLDIVVEGDAIRLGHILAGELDAAIVTHKRFGTCSIIKKDKPKIDIATARKETYGKPGALPTVNFSSLKDDLIRRDFTINAMAISLNSPNFGRLIDFFNGKRDLARGIIRVMHDRSFIDDPTRIFRAVRFEARFGFAVDLHTRELIKDAIERSMLYRLSRDRVRNELILMLQERKPIRALSRMAGLDKLSFIHRAVKIDDDLVRSYGSIDDVCALYERRARRDRAIDKWLMYLMALFEGLTYGQVSAICSKFALRSYDSLRLLSYKRRSGVVMELLSSDNDLAPSKIYKLLKPLCFEVILLIMGRTSLLSSKVKASLVRSRIKAFIDKYNGTKLRINGDDLKTMGLKSGPDYRMILDKALCAKIDGKLKTKKSELKYAQALIDRLLSKKML